MEEIQAKNKLILTLLVVIAILLVVSAGSCANSSKARSVRNKEMATRLDLEEKMAKFSKEKKTLEDKLAESTQQAQENKTALDAAKKALLQEQLVNQSLKEDLQKVTKLKETLEEDLKEALNSKAKNKK